MQALRDGHFSRMPPRIKTATQNASSRMTPRLLTRLQRAQRLRRLEERQELRVVPELAVDARRVELGALEPELQRALELADRRLHVLHGQRREAREASGPLLRH